VQQTLDSITIMKISEKKSGVKLHIREQILNAVIAAILSL